jgi:hypothetical protein
MSSNQPPSGPPNQPPGPPPGRPAGPPPQQPPYAQGPGADQTVGPWGTSPEQAPSYGPPPGYRPPEVLESGAGGPMPPQGPPTQGGTGGGRRKAILAGGTVVGVAALAGGAFAVYSTFFATGPQPAEALPASTLGYISIDLKPSGDQQVEALETLNKFPAFADQVDLGADDDVREYLFDKAQAEGACPDLSWDDDIEPWLGDRLGAAVVDLGQQDDDGNPEPTVVGVVQVKDADAAEDGLAALRDCASGPADAVAGSSDPEGATTEEPAASAAGGWVIEGEWAVVAETEDLAQQVVDAAQDDPLSDTDAYQKWTDAVGDPGIVNAYASPEAGSFIAENFASSFAVPDYACAEAVEPGSESGTDLGDDSGFGCEDSEGDTGGMSAMTQQLEETFADFDGAAMVVRFEDGGVELETASNVDFGGLGSLYETDRGDDVVSTLPSDTAIAVGLGFEDGWFGEITDYVASFSGGMVDVDEALAQIEAETGLTLPEDAEALAGDSAAFALNGSTDFAAAEDDPTAVLGGIKVQGDPDSIEAVVDKLLGNPSTPAELKDALSVQSDDDTVVLSFNEGYASDLLEDGDLGDSEKYQDVVEESGDAAGVLFIDFDADGWLDRVVAESGDQEVIDNVKPLSALGWSVWSDDDVAHSRLRVTFD